MPIAETAHSEKPCAAEILSNPSLDSTEDDWRSQLINTLEKLRIETEPEGKVALSLDVVRAIQSLHGRNLIEVNGIAAVVRPDAIPVGDLKSMLAFAEDYAVREFSGKTVKNKSDGSLILISRSGIKHSTHHRAGVVNALVATALDSLLENSQYLRTAHDKSARKDILAVHFYGGKVDLGDGRIVDVGVVVREHVDGRRYYHHFELKTKSPTKAGDSGVSLDGAYETATSSATEALGHRPMTKDSVNLHADRIAVNHILDSVSPLEKIKLSAALASAVKALSAEQTALSRVKRTSEVARILAKLGAGAKDQEPVKKRSLHFSLADKETSSESLTNYLSGSIKELPSALTAFEMETVGELAGIVGNHYIAATAMRDANNITQKEEAKLAVFAEMSSRGVKVGIDAEVILRKSKEASDALKNDGNPEYVAAQEAIRKLNDVFRAHSAELQKRIGEEIALLSKGQSERSDLEFMEAELSEMHDKYRRDYSVLDKASTDAIKEQKIRRAKLAIDQFKEEGGAVIAAVAASSPISEEQASGWAANQVIDDNAKAKLKRLGYKPEDVVRDMAEFYRITGGKASAVRISIDGSRRANATGVSTRLDEKVINLGAHFNKTVLFHELAHHLENDPIAKAASNGFLLKRRESSRVYSLASLTGNRGYRASEAAYKDDFMDPYIGKVYRDGITEVFSMGVQYLSNPKDAAIFAAKDPEMFAMITGYLSSPLTPAMEAKLNMHGGVIEGKQAEQRQESEEYIQAMKSLGRPITITKDGWWDDLKTEQNGLAYSIERYILGRSKTPHKYVGSYKSWRVFEGSFRNRNTKRVSKGFIVTGTSAGFSNPDSTAIHGDLDAVKLFLALAEREPGKTLDKIWYDYFYESRHTKDNFKKAIISVAKAAAEAGR